MTAETGIPRNPLIVLCAPEHADILTSQFSRYVNDYDVRVTGSSVSYTHLTLPTIYSV